MQGTGSPGAAGAGPGEPGVAAPEIRVGILVEGERVSIGADSGLSLRLRIAGESGVRLVSLPRATFRRGRFEGRVHVLETGQDAELASVAPAVADELLQVDTTAYRGLVEVRPAPGGTLTVVNRVNLEDYLRGVVPNELSPLAFPRLEALKAQAVAARGELLARIGTRHFGDPFLVCATQHCQVYGGIDPEHPRTTRAVEATRGEVLLRDGGGGLVPGYYSASCGGFGESNENIWGTPPIRLCAGTSTRSARAPRRCARSAPA